MSNEWKGAADWLRNNYQDYQNVASLCDAMKAAAPVSAIQPAGERKVSQCGMYEYTTTPPVSAPVPEAEAEQAETDQHYDEYCIDVFAKLMKEKMAASRAKGRSGWDDPERCSVPYLQKLLHEHIAKGDPVDVANFCMMLGHYKASTSPGFDVWFQNHYTKVLLKSVAEDYVPRTPAAPAVKHEASELPPKPEPCKQVLPLGWIRYTPDQMDAYVLADRAARQAPSIAAPAGSIGDDARFVELAHNWRRFETTTDLNALVAYIDARSPVAAPDTSAREVPGSLVAWANETDPIHNEWSRGYENARRWVRHQIAAMSATAASSGEKGET